MLVKEADIEEVGLLPAKDDDSKGGWIGRYRGEGTFDIPDCNVHMHVDDDILYPRYWVCCWSVDDVCSDVSRGEIRAPFTSIILKYRKGVDGIGIIELVVRIRGV